MRGQIIKRGDNTWLLRVSLGRDANGKRRVHNETFHGTKKAAGEQLTAVLHKRDRGVAVEPTKLTVDQYLDRWLADAAKGALRERTYASYEDVLRLYVRDVIGTTVLSRLTPLAIQEVYTKMRDDKLSARTIRYAHAVLSSALTQAVKWRILPHNPAAYVDLPRQTKKEMQALSPEQAGQFLEAAQTTVDCACHPKRQTPGSPPRPKGCRYSPLFGLALTGGLRPGEYLGLQWQDMDFDSGILTVRRTLVRNAKGEWSFDETKTKRSARSVPLPRTVTRALVEHRRRQAAERLEAGPDYQNNDFIFATITGKPLEVRNLVNRHFKPILKTAKLPASLRLYDLRHSCATLLLAQGEHPKIVSERLGHASVTLTLDTYSHVLPTMQQQAAERLEAVLFGGRG